MADGPQRVTPQHQSRSCILNRTSTTANLTCSFHAISPILISALLKSVTLQVPLPSDFLASPGTKDSGTALNLLYSKKPPLDVCI
ncbi:Ankyrin-3 [Fusarium oxysporum f. sp. albedinis]|nr:Ankyrin-3 [Fusarium oxysporum f. sp. albedinis]